MQQPQDLVRVYHRPDPRVPRRVLEPVAEAHEEVHYDEGWVGGMHADDDVADELRKGGEEGDAALAVLHVDWVVYKGGGSVADEGGEED